SHEDERRLRREIDERLREPVEAIRAHRPRTLYGSSGAIHSLAHVAHWQATGRALDQVNGHVFTLDDLQSVTARLRRMSAREREALPAIDRSRAEIIVAGAMVLEQVLGGLGVDSITLSDYRVREGLVAEHLLTHRNMIAAVRQVPSLRMRSVLQCLARFETDPA